MTYTYPELCALFKLSPLSNQMRKRLVALQQSGFPPPLPGGGGRWSKPAVDAWMHNWGNHATPSAIHLREATADTAQDLTHLQHALHQIYN